MAAFQPDAAFLVGLGDSLSRNIRAFVGVGPFGTPDSYYHYEKEFHSIAASIVHRDVRRVIRYAAFGRRLAARTFVA